MSTDDTHKTKAQLIAECAHDWPAQKLLDYGDATLGSLRPGMVYVGGTDPGRGIPTLLNETGDGAQTGFTLPIQVLPAWRQRLCQPWAQWLSCQAT